MNLTNEMYEELKAKIVEAVPEIMELKFGCKFGFISHDPMFTYTIARVREVFGAGGKVWEIVGDSRMIAEDISQARRIWDAEIYPTQDCKILGRDITLEDVLRAAKSRRAWLTVMEYGSLESVNQRGEKYSNWVFGQPLHLQSEETKLFLYNILCKNKN